MVGPGLRISHGVGIVIGNGVTIGARCLLMQGVTLGAPSRARIGDMPTLGDDVVAGAGACVIGRIRVGVDAAAVRRELVHGVVVVDPEEVFGGAAFEEWIRKNRDKIDNAKAMLHADPIGCLDVDFRLNDGKTEKKRMLSESLPGDPSAAHAYLDGLAREHGFTITFE